MYVELKREPCDIQQAFEEMNQLIQGLRASLLVVYFSAEMQRDFSRGTTLYKPLLIREQQIHDPVPAKFNHVTTIVTCTLLRG